jgi:hypothetical protein
MITTQIKAGDTISVSRKWWKMSKGRYEWTKISREQREAGERAELVCVETDFRPETCRPTTPGNFYGDCKCGECLTDRETRQMVVEEIAYYADNSTEATVRDDFGNAYQVMLVAPHGDACF